MQLRRLAALEQQKITDEKNGLETEITRLETILSSEANIKDEIRRETKEDCSKVRRQAQDPDCARYERPLHRGPHRGQDRPCLHHDGELHQADGPRHLPEAAPRRPRRHRHDHEGRGPGRLGLCRRHEGLPPLLHEHRTGLLAQGLPDPRELPRCQGQADRQPPQLKRRGRHDRHPDPRVPGGPVPPVRDETRAGDQDPVRPSSPTPARPGRTRSGSRRTTGSSTSS